MLTATAIALAKWLDAWRLLAPALGGFALIGAAIGLSLYGAELIGIYAPDTQQQLSLAAVTLAVGAFFIWLIWSVLTDLKLWVTVTLSAVGKASTDNNLTRLQHNLSRKLNVLVWSALLAQLLFLLFVVTFLSWGATNFGVEHMLVIAVALLITAAAFLVNIYFPIRALRQFLADATARLIGQAQAVQPSADRLSTWVLVVIFLQLVNASSGLFPSPDPLFTLVWLVLVVTFTALFALPLLKLRQFADLLACILDEKMESRTTLNAPTAVKSAHMGLLADEEERRATEGEREGRP